MFRLPEFRRVFRFGFRRPDAAPGDIDAEVEFHLKMRVHELMARGWSEAAARTEAVRRFGDVTTARAELIATHRTRSRIANRIDWLADLGRDLRFAARELGRNWSFAAVAVGVLGLGIGLTTAMVSLFDRLALHPLPYPNADRLAVAWFVAGTVEHSMRINPDRASRTAMATVPGVERVDAHQPAQSMVDIDGTPEVIPTRLVTIGMLEGLGAKLAAGRGFLPEDSSAASPLVTILSHTSWTRRFGHRADVVGRTVQVDGQVATIIGVFQPGFDLTSIDHSARAELWLPLRASLTDPTQDRTEVLLTLAPGARAAAVAAAIDARLKAGAGAEDNFLKSFHPALLGANELVDDSLRKTLSLLLAAVGLVLVAACANVAALLLGQAVGRSQEFGVRSALGAGRGRVIRQLAAESTLLGGLGAIAGIVVTVAVLALARRFRPEDLLTIDDVQISAATFLIAAALTLGATLCFGLAPIWAVSRTDAATALVGRARRSLDTRGAGRLRSGLVVGQIAITLVLLLGAGLLIKSFVREMTLPLGFEATGLAEVSMSLPEREFPTAARRDQVVREVVERVRRVPGVTMVTAAANGPLNFGVMQAEFLPADRPWPAADPKAFFPTWSIGPDYFAVIGLRLVAGATISPDTAAREIIIDEATAVRVWGTAAAAVGQRVRFGRDNKDTGSTVIGVAASLRSVAVDFAGAPTVYRRMETGDVGETLLIRSTGASPIRAVSRIIRETDPGLRIRSAATISDLLAERTAGTRFTMAIVVFFSVLSLGLALVGLYGLIAFAVRQRHFEFGVRLAIGAVPSRISAMVLRDALLRIGAGLGVGLLGSAGLVRLIRSMLYQMSPWDPWVFGGAAVLLGVVGIGAAWIPARRASQVDPLVAIRSE